MTEQEYINLTNKIQLDIAYEAIKKITVTEECPLSGYVIKTIRKEIAVQYDAVDSVIEDSLTDEQ